MNGTPKASPYGPWSYTGMDTSVPQHDLTAANCLPALVVWLAITANPNYQAVVADNVVATLATTTGLSKRCLSYLLNLWNKPIGPDIPTATTEQVQAAFGLVGLAFHRMGDGLTPIVPGPYLPDNCPPIKSLLPFAEVAGMTNADKS